MDHTDPLWWPPDDELTLAELIAMTDPTAPHYPVAIDLDDYDDWR